MVHFSVQLVGQTSVKINMAGTERSELWRQMVDYNPQYAHYQEQVERQIPVFLLTREAGQ